MANENLSISQTGINLIKKWEGVRLTAYQDSVGVWTIGYGHTKGVYAGMTISQAQADQFLKEDIKSHVYGSYNYVTVQLNQNQFDALASFQFNLGPHILKGSALVNYINAKQWQNAANEMKLYNKAGGEVLQGLVNRRNDEAALFLKSGGGTTTPPTQLISKWAKQMIYLLPEPRWEAKSTVSVPPTYYAQVNYNVSKNGFNEVVYQGKKYWYKGTDFYWYPTDPCKEYIVTQYPTIGFRNKASWDSGLQKTLKMESKVRVYKQKESNGWLKAVLGPNEFGYIPDSSNYLVEPSKLKWVWAKQTLYLLPEPKWESKSTATVFETFPARVITTNEKNGFFEVMYRGKKYYYKDTSFYWNYSDPCEEYIVTQVPSMGLRDKPSWDSNHVHTYKTNEKVRAKKEMTSNGWLEVIIADNKKGYIPNSTAYLKPVKPPVQPSTKFIAPITGKITITSPYGYRYSPISGGQELHNGIDIVNGNASTPILASMDGVVVQSGWVNSYGNYVILKHSNGKFTGYAHNSKLTVSVNQTVKQGQQIAVMGSTGDSTGAHCHFQIMTQMWSGFENPANYIKFV